MPNVLNLFSHAIKILNTNALIYSALAHIMHFLVLVVILCHAMWAKDNFTLCVDKLLGLFYSILFLYTVTNSPFFFSQRD